MGKQRLVRDHLYFHIVKSQKSHVNCEMTYQNAQLISTCLKRKENNFVKIRQNSLRYHSCWKRKKIILQKYCRILWDIIAVENGKKIILPRYGRILWDIIALNIYLELVNPTKEENLDLEASRISV